MCVKILKFKYLKTVQKYGTWVNVLYFPPLLDLCSSVLSDLRKPLWLWLQNIRQPSGGSISHTEEFCFHRVIGQKQLIAFCFFGILCLVYLKVFSKWLVGVQNTFLNRSKYCYEILPTFFILNNTDQFPALLSIYIFLRLHPDTPAHFSGEYCTFTLNTFILQLYSLVTLQIEIVHPKCYQFIKYDASL